MPWGQYVATSGSAQAQGMRLHDGSDDPGDLPYDHSKCASLRNMISHVVNWGNVNFLKKGTAFLRVWATRTQRG